MTDSELLRRYVRERSDAAFEELMKRHVNLVYSSARRQTTDSHAAEDVTQAVFLVLARKAASLPDDVVLPAWLLTTTRLTASNVRRQDQNRQRNEREAAKMNAEPPQPSPEWARVAPHLDDALASLSETDRSAVVLRYFERRPLNEVGTTLGISADAAEKRVTRALEKLRRIFSRRDVSITGLALAALLSENSVHAAPPVFAAALPQALAVAKAGLQISPAVTLANGAITIMAIAKAKQLALCAILFSIFGLTGGILLNKWMTPQPERQIVEKVVQQKVQTLKPPPETVKAARLDPLPERVEPNEPPLVIQPRPGINLLARLDPAADSVNGKWRYENGELFSSRQCYARFELPYTPPPEYDFHISFTVLEPRGDIGMVCPHGNTNVLWKMGSHGNRVAVFENGYGDSNESRTTIDNMFVKGERYDVVVTVRNDLATAYFNGKRISWLPINKNDKQVMAFWGLSRKDAVGVATWGTLVQFHTIEVVEQTGKGAFTRDDGEPGKPRFRPQLAPADAWNNATELLPLIDPKRDAVAGGWTKNADGSVSCEAGIATRLEIPYQPPDEYDIKVEFTRESGKQDIDMIMGRENKSLQWMIGRDNRTCGFQLWTNKADWINNPATAIVPNCLKNGVRAVSVVQIRKNYFCAFLNGELISYWDTPDSYGMLAGWELPTPGRLGIGSNQSAVTFHSIKILPISGQGTPAKPNLARLTPEEVRAREQALIDADARRVEGKPQPAPQPRRVETQLPPPPPREDF